MCIRDSPTGITQNVKDLLSSREVENIFENSDYVYMLNQASGDRQILAKQLNISPHQLSLSLIHIYRQPCRRCGERRIYLKGGGAHDPRNPSCLQSKGCLLYTSSLTLSAL